MERRIMHICASCNAPLIRFRASRKLDTRNNHGFRAVTGVIAGIAARGAI
jgi:hypothetical protein